jgi:hypothetical protein
MNWGHCSSLGVFHPNPKCVVLSSTFGMESTNSMRCARPSSKSQMNWHYVIVLLHAVGKGCKPPVPSLGDVSQVVESSDLVFGVVKVTKPKLRSLIAHIRTGRRRWTIQDNSRRTDIYIPCESLRNISYQGHPLVYYLLDRA